MTGESKIRKSLFLLFKCYGVADKERFDAYLVSLAGLAPDSVSRACVAAMRGELGGNPAFLPTAAELAKYAREIMPRHEPPKLTAAPSQAETNPAMAARLGRMMRELAASLRMADAERNAAELESKSP